MILILSEIWFFDTDLTRRMDLWHPESLISGKIRLYGISNFRGVAGVAGGRGGSRGARAPGGSKQNTKTPKHRGKSSKGCSIINAETVIVAVIS